MKTILKFLGTPFFLAGAIYKGIELAFGYGADCALRVITVTFIGAKKMAEIEAIEKMIRDAVNAKRSGIQTGNITVSTKPADPKDVN